MLMTPDGFVESFERELIGKVEAGSGGRRGENKCKSRWAKKINEGDLQVRLFLSVPPSPLVKDGGEIIVGIDQCLVLVISFFDGLFAVQVTVVVDSFVDGGGCTKFLFLPCYILIGEWSGE